MISSHTQIDCKRTDIAYTDLDFPCNDKLSLQQSTGKHDANTIGRRPIRAGYIIHFAKVHLTILDYMKQLLIFVGMLGHYPTILRYPWLR